MPLPLSSPASCGEVARAIAAPASPRSNSGAAAAAAAPPTSVLKVTERGDDERGDGVRLLLGERNTESGGTRSGGIAPAPPVAAAAWSASSSRSAAAMRSARARRSLAISLRTASDAGDMGRAAADVLGDAGLDAAPSAAAWRCRRPTVSELAGIVAIVLFLQPLALLRGERQCCQPPRNHSLRIPPSSRSPQASGVIASGVGWAWRRLAESAGGWRRESNF